MKIGDVVYLKSEPNIKMTVQLVEGKHVDTRWFFSGVLNQGRFHEDALAPVTAPAKER